MNLSLSEAIALLTFGGGGTAVDHPQHDRTVESTA